MKNKLTIGLLLLSLMTACASDAEVIQETEEITEVINDTEVLSNISVEYKEDDLLMEYTDYEIIELNTDSITYTGSNGYVDGSTITITKAGVYKLSGSLTDGMVIVNTSQEEDVVLVLDNVNIHNEDGPAISVLQADKVILNLMEGSINTLSDGSTYTLSTGEDEPNATIYSKDDLTINGLGTLNIESNYNHGIYTKDDLKLISGTINVVSVNDGIKGKNYIAIKDVNLSIVSNGDGLQSNNSEDSSKGYILIEGGKIVVESGLDGIQAETELVITDGVLTITSGLLADSTESGKSLKASASLEIDGGTLNLNSESDDAIHSNNSVLINGGNITISAYDDAIHSDDLLQIDKGIITITQSYEGLEGNTIVINGGDINLVASDDGVNTAGGNDGSGTQNGRNDMFASDGSTLTINGGNILVNANSDGLDSNGSITQNGGTVIVFGPTNSGNGALDYNASYTLNSGTLLAVGSNGMAQNVSESSIYSFLIGTDTVQANAWVSIVQDDQPLISFNSPKAFQTIVYASNELEAGTVQILTNTNINSNTCILSVPATTTDFIWTAVYTSGIAYFVTIA
ncbi:MAG: carbohydrate-binding domain-containing protein, partial [Erysipelotrichaceae bacterium]|nr:carbohydrate-binding domain-containing protein [Erysipelotrichaceae bacterium]